MTGDASTAVHATARPLGARDRLFVSGSVAVACLIVVAPFATRHFAIDHADFDWSTSAWSFGAVLLFGLVRWVNWVVGLRRPLAEHQRSEQLVVATAALALGLCLLSVVTSFLDGGMRIVVRPWDAARAAMWPVAAWAFDDLCVGVRQRVLLRAGLVASLLLVAATAASTGGLVLIAAGLPIAVYMIGAELTRSLKAPATPETLDSGSADKRELVAIGRTIGFLVIAIALALLGVFTGAMAADSIGNAVTHAVILAVVLPPIFYLLRVAIARSDGRWRIGLITACAIWAVTAYLQVVWRPSVLPHLPHRVELRALLLITLFVGIAAMMIAYRKRVPEAAGPNEG